MYGEKFRNVAPQYKTGDVIGVSVDVEAGDLKFYLNGVEVMEWRGTV